MKEWWRKSEKALLLEDWKRGRVKVSFRWNEGAAGHSGGKGSFKKCPRHRRGEEGGGWKGGVGWRCAHKSGVGHKMAEGEEINNVGPGDWREQCFAGTNYRSYLVGDCEGARILRGYYSGNM